MRKFNEFYFGFVLYPPYFPNLLPANIIRAKKNIPEKRQFGSSEKVIAEAYVETICTFLQKRHRYVRKALEFIYTSSRRLFVITI